jgi:hypothetical protein
MQLSKSPLSGGNSVVSVVPEQQSIQAMIDLGVNASLEDGGCNVALGEYFDRSLYPIDPGAREEVYRLFASNGQLVRENLSFVAPQTNGK